MRTRLQTVFFGILLTTVLFGCKQETCTDGILNNNEIKVDCGGPNCDLCPNCFDGILNNEESQIDCGGPNCEPCQYSWKPVESGTTEHLHDVAFKDELNGFVVGEKGTVLKTTDGGATWTTLSSPAEFAIFSIELLPNDGIIIAGGEGKMYKSTNQGASWVALNSRSPSNIFDLEFLDASIGFYCGAEQQLAITADGGETWEYKDLNPGANASYNALYFLDDDIGYAVADGYYRKTIDGGASWPATISVEGDVYDIEVLSTKRWFATSTKGLLLSNDSTVVNKSIPIISGGLGHYEEILYLAAQDESQQNGVIYRSVDNGVVWKLEHYNGGESFQEVVALNTKEAIAVGANGVIYRRSL